ncbi:MAG TPA: tRNA (adenosine(37)-N6)-dimethylallyltransferase MiaA [Planctomycetota bacterium]|nr:tRNA (adenosine(37)-N6)-dimethylallyltransferase MiaA [Planctomycetota bacterium]
MKNHLFILGPTASGKHEAAMEIARRLRAEIISVDSMKVYRGLDIGTAKPSAIERAEIRHHLVDILDPSQRFTAGAFVEAGERAEVEISGRGVQPVFSGGTFLYYKAYAYGLFRGPPPSPELREELHKLAGERGPHTLHHELSSVDPAAAARIHPNDLKRLVRALEIHRTSGHPISQLQHQWPGGPRPGIRAYCLSRPLVSMDRRIELRVDRMLNEGLVEEARGIHQAGVQLNPEIQRAIGYAECFAAIQGEISLIDARKRMIQRTRRFVRRQLAWARSLAEVELVPLASDAPPAEAADRIMERLRV